MVVIKTEMRDGYLEKCKELMRHALGFGHKKPYTRHGKKFYRPYRNYFETHAKTVDYPYWERMVKAGLANKKEDGESIWYFVTRSGMDWLGQHDGIHIYDKQK